MKINNELQIEVLKEGDGDFPKIGDTVLMHYELWATPGVTSSFIASDTITVYIPAVKSV